MRARYTQARDKGNHPRHDIAGGGPLTKPGSYRDTTMLALGRNRHMEEIEGVT